VRDVFQLRLSDTEREQITRAAAQLELPPSSFVRQAALEVSARVTRKVAVRAPEPKEHDMGLVMVGEPEPSRHMVDGEPIYR
jgi:uncharacterized protein (DUF1778 family)